MTATNSGGSVTCDATISTELNIVLTPPSCTLQATNNDNGTVTLSWNNIDALAANINNNVGDVNAAS